MSQRKKRPSNSKTKTSANSAQTPSESPLPAQESSFPTQPHISQETIQELLLGELPQPPTVDEVLGYTCTLEGKRSSPGIPTGVFFQSLNTILYNSPNPFAPPRASFPTHPEDAWPKPDSSLTIAGAGDFSPPLIARTPRRPQTSSTAREPLSQPGKPKAGIPPTPKQPPAPKPPPPTPKTPTVEAAKKLLATMKAPKKAAARSKTGQAKHDTAGLLDSNIIAAPTGTTGRTTRSTAGTLPEKPERLVNAVTAPAAEKRERKSKPAPIKVVKPSSSVGKRSGPSPYQTGNTPGRKGLLQPGSKSVKFMTDEGMEIPERWTESVSLQGSNNLSVRSRPKTPFAREVASPGDKRPQNEIETSHDSSENAIYSPFPKLSAPSENEKEEHTRKTKEVRAKEKATVKPWKRYGTSKISPKRAWEEEGIQGRGQGQGPNKKRKRRGKKHRGGNAKDKGGDGNKT